MTGNQITLVGDEIENPFNIEAMMHAAEMFGAGCRFHAPQCAAPETDAICCEELPQTYSPVIALDNWKTAQVLYGYQLKRGAHAALVAGNERKGISRAVSNVATDALTIPMSSRKLNCLNVAAASAVALYYLTNGLKGRMQIRAHPEKYRPELLISAGEDHAELGSAIRSAAAFGWNRAFIEDRCGIWFGCDRIKRAEGRAAARRGRNQIRLIDCSSTNQYLFREAIVVTTAEAGESLEKVNLSRGGEQVLVIADESSLDVHKESWSRVAKKVSFARIRTTAPGGRFTYHFRHLASIALAETARQVGQSSRYRPTRQEPLYQSALELILDQGGEQVCLEDLFHY